MAGASWWELQIFGGALPCRPRGGAGEAHQRGWQQAKARHKVESAPVRNAVSNRCRFDTAFLTGAKAALEVHRLGRGLASVLATLNSTPPPLLLQLVMAQGEHAKMMPRSPGGPAGPAAPRKPVDTACCGASFLAEFFHMFNLVFLVSVRRLHCEHGAAEARFDCWRDMCPGTVPWSRSRSGAPQRLSSRRLSALYTGINCCLAVLVPVPYMAPTLIGSNVCASACVCDVCERVFV